MGYCVAALACGSTITDLLLQYIDSFVPERYGQIKGELP